MRNKKKIGIQLNSDAMIADANCTRVCMQLSFILLIASLGYEVFEIGSIDAVGSLFIAGISFKEGREAFEKSANRSDCCWHPPKEPLQFSLPFPWLIMLVKSHSFLASDNGFIKKRNVC